jgi:purine-binding chemotaxis protein CheW
MALQSHVSGSTGAVSTTQESAASVAQKLQFITFTLGTEEYGVDIMMVREIKGWSATTRIPNAAPHVRGVINLRGVIIPIFDLNARFGMGLTDPTKMHVVIIVNTGTRTVGLLVDTVSDIISVEPGAIRPVPEMGAANDDNFLDGLVALGDRMVTLVSLAGLFRDRAGASAFGDTRSLQ